jgi:PAS domain S-box-containing protein
LRRFTDEELLDDARRVLADLMPQDSEVQGDDGRWYIRRITPYRTHDDRIEGVVITFVDVADLKEAEEALSRLNAELEERVAEQTGELRTASLYARSLIEASLDPLVTISPEGRITDVSEATEQVTGRTRRELIGTDFSDYFTEPDAAQMGYRKVFADGQVRDYPLRIRHASGSTTDVLYNATIYRNEAGEVQGVFAAARDVTELKRAEAALREVNETLELRVAERTADLHESQHRLAVIVDSIADGFYALDRDWRFTHVNDAALRHMGKTREEIIDHKLFEVFPAVRGSVTETQYRHAMESGEPVHFESPSIIADVILEIHAYPGPENLTVLFRDITERHRLTTALREAHERAEWLARFPDENPNPVMRVSADGIALYCNRTSVEIPGWACQVGEQLSDPFLPLVERAMIERQEIQQDVELGGRYYLVAVVPIPGKGYANVYGRDITERKLTEDALRESEERLKRAQEIAHLGSWELDLIQNRLTWSDEVYRIFGLQPQEFGATYETFLERVHPDDCASVDNAYSGSLRDNRNTYEIEHRVVRKDTGEIRIAHERCEHIRDATGKIIRSVGMVHDITERVRAEKAVLQAKQEWERTFDAVPDLIAILDDHHHILRANKAMAERLGVAPQQCVGETCHKAVHGLDYPPDFCPHTLALADGQEHVEEVHEDCLGGDFLVSATPLTDELGRLIGSVHVARDITKRKQAEQILLERTAELEALNRELESFSYSVSHDLRAPLRAIDGYARSILKKQEDKFDEDTKRRFNDIRLNAKMMGQLIDDLLAFSRLGKKHISISKLDMDAVITDVWKELQTANPERNMKLILNSMPCGCGDRTLIKQVYFNLLSNAVKFTKFRDAAHIEAGGYTEGNEDVYYLKDNGVGFDMAYYDKLFGVFQRLHNPDDFEGTGVGLATIQRIVHRHEGRVWAEGKVDEGATFYFSLPRKG